METLIHMTAAYSNAVLLVVLTHISDFARKLELPVPLPVTSNQVAEFKPHPFQHRVGGWLTLTNGDQFWFESGHVYSFQSSRDFAFVFGRWNPEDYWKATNYWGVTGCPDISSTT